MNQPDIIFIVLDTQRADRLGCYGHQKAITPNLDQFAARSVLFEQAISPAQWTIPSHASMFTGLYPTAHQVTQSAHSLNKSLPHVAEVLDEAGYETVAFCNNPLVGILNNGFKRGFQTFYNYGGAFPSLPEESSPFPWPLNHLTELYTQFLRRISYPIQNFFGRSDLAFRLSLTPWLTPLWSKLANFKGQNERSVRDVSRFLRQREKEKPEKPLFLFLNLMETHIPFWPPGEFIDQVAPYFRHDKEARDIVRKWNRESYRWAAPLETPLSDLETQVLSDLYDAEVAYQDAYLGELLQVLNGRSRHTDTLTILVADHGDGLGEHNYFGHAFVAYQELVHVPLMVQWPHEIKQNGRITAPVSTRRVFHTMLAALPHLPNVPGLNPGDIHSLTLLHNVNGREVENNTAYAEVYPPMNFVSVIERRWPHLLEPYGCLSTRRAAIKQTSETNTHKFIQKDEKGEGLFNLTADPLELDNVIRDHQEETAVLEHALSRLVTTLQTQRQSLADSGPIEIDDHLLQRLRGLGYIE